MSRSKKKTKLNSQMGEKNKTIIRESQWQKSNEVSGIFPKMKPFWRENFMTQIRSFNYSSSLASENACGDFLLLES